MSLRRVHIFVEGRVQGVCFRYCTRSEAVKLGLSGWVRNLSDGRVEVLAEGEEDLLRVFLKFCSQGPSRAEVTDMIYEFLEYSGKFDGFSVSG
jgi:acylphosphatase